MFGTIRNVNAETLRHKDLKYPTHDLCLAKISHSSLVQKIHALVALPFDAGILCTSDLCEIQNTLLIIRDSLRSSSHDIVGYLLPATRHQWGILNPYAAKFLVFMHLHFLDARIFDENRLKTSQCPRTDLNKRLLPKPMTTTG